jgi:hypothetical protein
MKKLKVIYYTLRLPSAEQADGQFFAPAPATCIAGIRRKKPHTSTLVVGDSTNRFGRIFLTSFGGHLAN